MTNLFQPLDITVNRSTNAFTKRKFTKLCNMQVTKQLDNGKLLLSTLKSLGASQVLKLCSYLTSTLGKKTIANGWKAAGISHAIKKVLRLWRPSTLFPAWTLLTNQLTILSSTSKQLVLLQNLY